jgi:phosphonate transport system substrate-binding protein
MTVYWRNVAVLAGTALALGSTVAQTESPRPPAKAKAAAAPAVEKFSGPREKMVVAMPKTYGKTETMALWGDYFSHLSRCANVELQNAQGDSLERTSNVDILGEKELVEALSTGKAQIGQVNPGLAAQMVTAGQAAPFARAGQQGHRPAQLLQADFDQPHRQPVQGTQGPDRQEDRAHHAHVQLGQPGAARAVPGPGPDAGQGL